jgi:BMFP domain-containing protein YqiC
MHDKFIGIENVCKQLGRYDHDGLAVFTIRGNDEIFRRYKGENESTDDVNESLFDFLTDLHNQNPDSFVGYKIQLYEFPQGAKKRKGTAVITFQLNETPNKDHFKSKSSLPGAEYVHKDTMLLAIENANLKNKNDELESRLAALESRMMDDPDDDDGDDQDEYVGAINTALRDKIPMLLDAALGYLFNQTPNQPSAGIAGIENESINDVIDQFKKINPNIESDLKKLLQLAINKPDLFKMLIQQLRMM